MRECVARLGCCVIARAGGQAQRSATLLQQLLKQPSGGAPSGQTILSVFEALYKQKQAVPAEELLAVS